jgi:hypothetical protein
MRELAALHAIPPMTPEGIAKVRDLEAVLLARYPDGNLPIEHGLHAGMYHRTVCVPAGMMMTGVLIRIPTLLIIQGDAFVWLGEEAKRVTGYHVVAASAGRKQAFRMVADTHITMVFATDATTVDEAERQFTDEWRNLASRKERT